jgi:hypothetical protein
MKKLSLMMLAAGSLVAACTGDLGNGEDAGTNPGSGSGSSSIDEWDTVLGKRVYDYTAALKVAALRLTGDLPTMEETTQVATAPDNASKAQVYGTIIKTYLERPTFATQMMVFWRDTFKMGGTAEMDAAPAFAAQLAVENRSYLELFTASENTCPTYNATTNTFTAASCAGNAPTAGVLTNPGAMKQFFGNFAFRRVRWVEETFNCLAYPVEVGAPQDIGGASPYLGVWPFTSISGADSGIGRVDFQDKSAVICANCHQTLNHIAPLFANFNANGLYQNTISVTTPLDGAPLAELSDYLPSGETTAWRFGKPAQDLPARGQIRASDNEIKACGVARVWNWALGKTDIVDTLQQVPLETIQTQVDAFAANGHKLKDLIYAVYTSDDFVKFDPILAPNPNP